ICDNKFELLLEEAHALILDGVEEDLFAPDVVDMAIDEALAALTGPPVPPATVDQVQHELRSVEGQLRNLTTAIAAGGDLTSLVQALREREQRRVALERQMATLTVPRVHDPRRLERDLRARVGEWRAMVRRQPQIARQALQKLLLEKVICTPKQDAHGQWF